MSKPLQVISFGIVAYIFYAGSTYASPHAPPVASSSSSSFTPPLSSLRDRLSELRDLPDLAAVERSIEAMAEKLPSISSVQAATVALAPDAPASGSMGRTVVLLGLGVAAVGLGEWVAERYGHGVIVDGREVLDRIGFWEAVGWAKRRAEGGSGSGRSARPGGRERGERREREKRERERRERERTERERREMGGGWVDEL